MVLVMMMVVMVLVMMMVMMMMMVLMMMVMMVMILVVVMVNARAYIYIQSKPIVRTQGKDARPLDLPNGTSLDVESGKEPTEEARMQGRPC